jgi:hypothetical protein
MLVIMEITRVYASYHVLHQYQLDLEQVLSSNVFLSCTLRKS